MYCNPSYGPTFGEGHDLHISNYFAMASYSKLGSTYIPIVGAFKSPEAGWHLAGAYNFEVKEMEVFSVEFEWLEIIIYNIKYINNYSFQRLIKN